MGDLRLRQTYTKEIHHDFQARYAQHTRQARAKLPDKVEIGTTISVSAHSLDAHDRAPF